MEALVSAYATKFYTTAELNNEVGSKDGQCESVWKSQDLYKTEAQHLLNLYINPTKNDWQNDQKIEWTNKQSKEW